MPRPSIFDMQFAKVYPCLIAKAERKGRTRAEVDAVTGWLLGYTPEAIAEALDSNVAYGEFFRNAPAPNPLAHLVKGSVCGVRVEAIEDPLERAIRQLDKLVDELAKGKPMEKILRTDAADR